MNEYPCQCCGEASRTAEKDSVDIFTIGPLLVAYNGWRKSSNQQNLRGLAHLPTLRKPLLEGFKEI